tara:strand:- start:389 stop:577 length:189 start_codon:yes stop_codon:yes gene_type:complete
MTYTLEILDIDAYDQFEYHWEGLDCEKPSTDSSGRWITRTTDKGQANVLVREGLVKEIREIK